MARRYASQKQEQDMDDLQRSMDNYKYHSRDSMRKSESMDDFLRPKQEYDRGRNGYSSDRYDRSSDRRSRVNENPDQAEYSRSRRRNRSKSGTGQRRSRSSKEYDSESDDGYKKMKQKDIVAAVNISIDETSKAGGAAGTTNTGTQRSKSAVATGGADVTRKTVTHAYVMAPTNTTKDEKRPIWKYAFYVCLVIIGSIIGVVSYVFYNKGSSSPSASTGSMKGTSHAKFITTPSILTRHTVPPIITNKPTKSTTSKAKRSTTRAPPLTTTLEPSHCKGTIYKPNHLSTPQKGDKKCAGKSAGTYNNNVDCSAYYICNGRGPLPWKNGLCPCNKAFDLATGKCLMMKDGYYVVPDNCTDFKTCRIRNGKTIRGSYNCHPSLAFTLSTDIPMCRPRETVPECSNQ